MKDGSRTDYSDDVCVVCGEPSPDLICGTCHALIGAKRVSVEEGPMDGKKHVLHPTDFSEASQPAFTVALDAARRHDAELILVHVLEPIPPLEDEADIARRLDAREAAEAAARKGFDGLLELAKKAGVAASDVLTEGSPSAEIARIAEQWHAVLIVMGTHGRTGMRKVSIGSVAERVIATAPCWVFTVRM